MKNISENCFLVSKNAFLFFKFIFRVFFICILFYQFIGITIDYLNFPYDVKLIVKDNNDLNVPSVTFCLKRDGLWRVKNFKGK